MPTRRSGDRQGTRPARFVHSPSTPCWPVLPVRCMQRMHLAGLPAGRSPKPPTGRDTRGRQAGPALASRNPRSGVAAISLASARTASRVRANTMPWKASRSLNASSCSFRAPNLGWRDSASAWVLRTRGRRQDGPGLTGFEQQLAGVRGPAPAACCRAEARPGCAGCARPRTCRCHRRTPCPHASNKQRPCHRRMPSPHAPT